MEEAIKLRPLETQDIFLITRVIAKIGIRKFKDCFKNEELKTLVANLYSEKADQDNKDGEKSAEDNLAAIGMFAAFDVADVLFENLPCCENELYNLLAALAGVKAHDIAKQAPAITMEMIIEVIQDPRFVDFFKVAFKLFNRSKTK